MKVCYTYGVFDLLHYGHIRQLRAAKKLCDHLIVGVFTDEMASSFKRTPVLSLCDRMEALNALRCVDFVVPQDTFSPIKNLGAFKPDIVAKGEGAGWTNLAPPREVEIYCELHHIKAIVLPRTDGISTSDIIKKIHAGNIK